MKLKTNWLQSLNQTVLAALCAGLLCLPAWSDTQPTAGNSNGGGGDFRAGQFVRIASELAQFFSEFKASELKPLDLRRYQQAVQSTTVESTWDSLMLLGVPKDAIADSKRKTIRFNRARWDDSSPVGKIGIVLHEYFRILGIPDDSYFQSQKVIDATGAIGRFKYADWMSAFPQGELIPVSILCKTYQAGAQIGKLPPVGKRPTSFGHSQATSVGTQLWADAQGRVWARAQTNEADHGWDPARSSREGNPPKLRIQVGYDRGDSPIAPEDALAELETRITLDIDVTLKVPKTDYSVRCRRMTTEEERDEMRWRPVF